MHYQYVPSHCVFDVKYDGRRKARIVAGGNVTEVDPEETYSGVVSLEMVRLILLIADINNLQVVAADISNAYHNAKTREKVWSRFEFGKLASKFLIIDMAQYGLKSSAARFHECCSSVLTKLGFTPSKADPDLWIKDKGSH